MKRRQWITQRVFIETNGDGPWSCYSCYDQVEKIGQDTWDGNIHHLDEDATNDSPENLVIMHVICHQRFHGPSSNIWVKGHQPWNLGKKATAEARAHMSVSKKANPPFLGKRHTDEARAKIAAAHRGMKYAIEKTPCEDCGKKYTKTWMNRHRREGRCTPTSPVSHSPADSTSV